MGLQGALAHTAATARYTKANPSLFDKVLFPIRSVATWGFKPTLCWSETPEFEFGALNRSATSIIVVMICANDVPLWLTGSSGASTPDIEPQNSNYDFVYAQNEVMMKEMTNGKHSTSMLNILPFLFAYFDLDEYYFAFSIDILYYEL